MLQLLIATLINGVSFIFIDMTTDYLPAIETNMLSFLIAALTLFLIIKIKKMGMRIEKKDFLLIAIAGISGTGMFFFLTNIAVRSISPSAVSAISGTVPIITIIISAVVFKKKIKASYYYCLILTSIGIVLVSNILFDPGKNTMFGIGLMLFTNVMWVIYTFINDWLMKKYAVEILLFWQVSSGAVLFLIMFLAKVVNGTSDLNLSPVNLELYGAILFIGILVMGLAYVLYFGAMEKLSIETCAFFMNMIPIVTFVISILFGFEAISFTKTLGVLLVVISAYLVSNLSEEAPTIEAYEEIIDEKSL